MLVESMIDFVGDLPPEWQSKADQIRLDKKDCLQPKASHHPMGVRLQPMFDEFEPDSELQILLPVIQGLTRFLPADRISASQALALIEENRGERHLSKELDDNSYQDN